MAKTKTAKLAEDVRPYVRRLLEDERVHAHLREAAGSLRGAAMALQRKPPPRPKRRGRKVVLVAALAGGAVVLAKRRSASTERRDYADRPAEPVEPGRSG
jgi:chemotaxis response regulator CheB